MDPVKGDVDDNHQHRKTHSANAVDEDGGQAQPILGDKAEAEAKKQTSCSSPTSSEDSEDFFQLDPAELSSPTPRRAETANGARGAAPQHGGNAQELNGRGANGFLSLIDDDDDDIFAKPQPVGRPLSPGQGPPPGANASGAPLPRQSPPAQMMARTDVPDPNRIPTSIFTRTKSSAPMEWSVASNESLFSIHVGNASFSREQFMMMGGKSGDFSPYTYSPGEHCPPVSGFPGSSPVGLDAWRGSAEPNATEAANAEAMKDAIRAHAEGQGQKEQHPAEVATLPTSLSHRSDASTTSYQSFAFPILIGEGRNSSVKVDNVHPLQPEKPQQLPVQTGIPKADARAGEKKWLSCFPCCPSCC